MARGRPKGSTLSPEAERSPGPPERFGHRSGRDALARGEPLKGLALKAKQEALERYEMEGAYTLALENWSDVAGVKTTFMNAFHSEEQKDEPNLKQIVELGRRIESLSKTFDVLLRNLEDLRVTRDGQTLEGMLSQTVKDQENGDAE